MNLKGIAKGLGVLNASAILVTAVMGWFLGRNSVPELFDIASYVALGMGALGSLMFVGATSGSDGSAERAATSLGPAEKIDGRPLDGQECRNFDWGAVRPGRLFLGCICMDSQ
jgi:hypothetical protein